jgi:hypothetical protein
MRQISSWELALSISSEVNSMTGKRPHTLIPLALSLLTMVGCAQPWASGGLSGVAETGYQAPVHSWKYHKEHNVVMQGLDFSCGSGDCYEVPL